jgi:RimJ/RimL family protein N-acetyltransferase
VKVLETQRLVLRRLRLDDAAFIVERVNDPSWLRYIGDKDVKSVEAARAYIAREAAAATLDYGRRVLGLGRIVAITSPDNEASIRVLETLGLRFDGLNPAGRFAAGRPWFEALRDPLRRT